MTQEPSPNSPKPVRQGPGSLIAGATYPFRALWLFTKYPKYRGYVLIPILINILLGITLYAGSLYLGFRLIDAIATSISDWVMQPHDLSASLPAVSLPAVSLPDWHVQIPWLSNAIANVGQAISNGLSSLGNALPSLPDWHFSLPDWTTRLPDWDIRLPDWFQALPSWGALALLWIVRVLLTIVLLFVTGFILLQFGVLLGSPWYGKLSEDIETLKTGQAVIIEVGLVRDIGRAIAYELKKLVIIFGLGIPLLLLGFFPGVGTLVGTIGGITITATLTCMDFIDSPLERRRLRFRQKLGIIWKSLPASATFGLVCLGLISIPFINLLAIPLCVAGGTLFACDRILPRLQLPASADKRH